MDIDNKVTFPSPLQLSVSGDLSFSNKQMQGIDAKTTSTDISSVLASSDSQQQRSEQLQGAVAKMNDFAQNQQRTIRFSIDEQSGRDVVTVLDQQTEEVIRQIPIEEVLVFVRNLAEQNAEEFNLFSSQA